MKGLLLVVLIGFYTNIIAQDRAVGVRVVDIYEGEGIGLSFKQKFHGKMSVEGVLGIDGFEQKEGFFKADFNVIQRPIPIEGLDWYLVEVFKVGFLRNIFRSVLKSYLG